MMIDQILNYSASFLSAAIPGGLVSVLLTSYLTERHQRIADLKATIAYLGFIENRLKAQQEIIGKIKNEIIEPLLSIKPDLSKEWSLEEAQEFLRKAQCPTIESYLLKEMSIDHGFFKNIASDFDFYLNYEEKVKKWNLDILYIEMQYTNIFKLIRVNTDRIYAIFGKSNLNKNGLNNVEQQNTITIAKDVYESQYKREILSRLNAVPELIESGRTDTLWLLERFRKNYDDERKFLISRFFSFIKRKIERICI